jgi:hypothetical protein
MSLIQLLKKKEFSGLFEMVAYLWQTKHPARIENKKKRYVNRKGDLWG